MARKISDIYTAIIADKDTQSSLQGLAPNADSEQQLLIDLNTSSKVAVWRLWAYIVASAIHVHELFFDLFKIEIEAKAKSVIVGTAAWYQRMVLSYQHGDSLVFNAGTGGYGYAAANAALQVVKRCAVVELQDSSLTLKVAGLDATGQPVALSAAHQTGLSAYVHKLRFAGTRYQIASGNGDIIKVVGNVYYSASMDLTVVKAAVELAVNGYVSQLPFDGEFLLTKLVDAIQSVNGVIDVQLISVQTKAFAAATYTPIIRIHTPEYGYYVIDTAVGSTLSDTLSYIGQ